MSTVCAKLKSNKGVSILMALLLVLLGITVSAVIISAALTAAAGSKSEREYQKAYLSVSSAAGLLSDSFSKTEHISVFVEGEGVATAPEITIKGECKELFTDAVTMAKSGTAYNKRFIVKAPDMQDVSVDFTMDEALNIVAVFSLDRGFGANAVITLSLSASESSFTAYGKNIGDVPHTVRTDTISWGAPQIIKGTGVSE